MLADPMEQQQRGGRLADPSLDLLGVVLLLGAVTGQRDQLAVVVRLRPGGESGLHHALGDEIRKPPVGCRRMRVVTHGQAEVAFRLPRTFHRVLAPPHQLDDREREIGKALGIRGPPSIEKLLQRAAVGRAREVLAERLGQLDNPLPALGRALEAFLTRRRAADPERFPDLSLSIVKLMGRGEYTVEGPGQAEGHFGLAVGDYTHSTAPNRRFPDLITQRLVKAALASGPSPYDDGELVALARHCTEQEHNAEKVERRVRKSAAALLLLHRIGERFAGLVTGASAKGTWVRIPAPPVEGRVVRGFRGLDVGDRVTVELLEVDVDRGYIDFGRIAS